jgi:hypothetical protein
MGSNEKEQEKNTFVQFFLLCPLDWGITNLDKYLVLVDVLSQFFNILLFITEHQVPHSQFSLGENLKFLQNFRSKYNT